MVFNFFFMKLNVLVLFTVEKVCQQNSAEWSTVTLLERLGQTPPPIILFSIHVYSYNGGGELLGYSASH